LSGWWGAGGCWGFEIGAGGLGAPIASAGGAILLKPLLMGVWGPGVGPVVETLRANGDLGLCMPLCSVVRFIATCALFGRLFLRRKWSEETAGFRVTPSGSSPWGTLKSTSSKSSPRWVSCRRQGLAFKQLTSKLILWISNEVYEVGQRTLIGRVM